MTNLTEKIKEFEEKFKYGTLAGFCCGGDFCDRTHEEDFKDFKDWFTQAHQDLVGEIKVERELHTHNSIPGYTDDLEEGCSVCLKNSILDAVEEQKREVLK